METRSIAQALEAALFSAGRPLGLDELREASGASRRQVEAALEHLRDGLLERDSALEVARAGDKWAMQVRSTHAEGVRKLAPMEVPLKVLKTLALIAYHQPILQSDLQDMVGSKVYDHVAELRELGLVRRRRHERSYVLRTTPAFPEYFGLEATDEEGIRRTLAERVGIPLPTDDGRGNRKLTTYAEDEGEGDDDAPADDAAEVPEGATEAAPVTG